MKKRLLAITVSVAVLMTMLSACGKTPENTVGTGDVEIIEDPVDAQDSYTEPSENGSSNLELDSEEIWDGPEMVAGPLTISSIDNFDTYTMYDSYLYNDGYSCDVLVPSLETYNFNSEASRSEQVYLMDKYDWDYGDYKPDYFFTKEASDDHTLFTYTLNPITDAENTRYTPYVIVDLRLDEEFVHLDEAKFMNDQLDDLIDETLSEPNRDKSGSDDVFTYVSPDYMGVYIRHTGGTSGYDLCNMMSIRRFVDDRQILTISVISNVSLETSELSDTEASSVLEQGIQLSEEYILDAMGVYGLGEFANSLIENGELTEV